MTINKIRVAIIGGNYGLKVIYPAFNCIKDVKVVGLSLSNKKKLNAYKLQTNLINFFSSWKKMLNEVRPDLVAVAVPPKYQFVILKYLIEKKNTFFC